MGEPEEITHKQSLLYRHEDFSLDTGTYVKAGDGSLRLKYQH